VLIKLLDHLKKVEILKRQYIGIVVDNEDPKRLGRVKVTIAGVLTGEADTLPWVFPKNPPGQGGTGATGAIECPDVGSQLIIEFPFEDVYSPFYTGFWQSNETHQGEFDEDYPNTRGWQDADGTYFKVNTAKRFSDYYHAAGSRMRHNADGSIDIISPTGINLMSPDGKAALRVDCLNGDISFANRNQGELSGVKTKISSKVHEVAVGSVKDNATGAREVITGGGYKHIVAGGASESIVSNKALSVGGDVNETIAGKTEKIIGMGRSETIALGDDEKFLTAGDRKTEILLGNYKITLTAGNYDVSVVAGDITLNTAAGNAELSTSMGKMTVSATGDLEASNSMGKMTIAATGDIEVSNNLGKQTISAAGEIEVANAVSKLKIDPAGLIGLGGPAAELLDLIDQFLDAFINQTQLCMTGVGPSSPLLPPALTTLIQIKVLLATIKGSV